MIKKFFKGLFEHIWNNATGGIRLPRIHWISWLKFYAIGLIVLAVVFYFLMEAYFERPVITIVSIMAFSILYLLILEPAMKHYFSKELKRKMEKKEELHGLELESFRNHFNGEK